MPEEAEREKLPEVIRQWNNNRLDLFEISQPDENLEFHGVMRFYFEDRVGGNVATKCLRVCSDASTQEVIDTLSEKFRPDMKMLTNSYSLYEIHANKERRLDPDQRPLVVQLNWTTDNREGRFVLKKVKESLEENRHEKEKGGVIQTFKRTLSRKDKKKEKNKTKATDTFSDDENGPTEKLLNNNSICVSNNEEKKSCTENPRPHWPAAVEAKHTDNIYRDSSDQPGLPIGIKFSDSSEGAFLSAVLNYTNSSTVHFKLSPAYVLYAGTRFALQRHHRRGSARGDHGVTLTASRLVAMTSKVIERQQAGAGALAFWMANCSELLNFLKHDKDLSVITRQSQLDLSHLVHKAYSCLLLCLQNDLRKHLPTFLIDPEQHGALPAGIEMVLNTLMNAMSLLRRCRVNPALTIQLFSQLFHFVSVWLFNQLMNPEANTPGLRSHYWGAALRQRLTAIEAWAERQGLELAADCHLGHILQATMLLTMSKYSMQDVKAVQSTCFKLNSLQLQTLLSGYLYATNEPRIPTDLIDAAVTAAKVSADNLIRSEGRDIRLEESLDLRLPFLLPEGGYSCDTVRGIPLGLREFLEPICQKGLCSLTSEPNSTGDWTVFFSEPTSSAESTSSATHGEPGVVTITLNKPLNSGMGVSIVAAKGAGQENTGIYIKSIVKGGPAEMNGKLTAGDQLLSVDGRSVIGLSQERAAAIMMQTGPVVTLQVAKFAASFHGLGAVLSDPTPETTTGGRGPTEPGGKGLALNSVDPAPSDRLNGGNRGTTDRIIQRNRQLYRSDPDMKVCFSPEEDDPVDPVVRGNNMAAVSTLHLCYDTVHREYLTLPAHKSQEKNVSETSRPQQTLKVSFRPLDGLHSTKRTFMRHALSQENLCVDRGGPLLDGRQHFWEPKEQRAKQTTSPYSSFPIRSSVSSHDILSDYRPPTKQQQGGRTSGAGVWRAPFSQHPTPTPSNQPTRVDIPVTRAMDAHASPPLTTFQGSSLQAARMCQTLKARGAGNRADHIYACPITATGRPPQPAPPSQQQRCNTHRDPAAKPQVSITPTKHVSFQEPLTEQEQCTGPARPKDPPDRCDPWRRDAQEKLEKQQRLRVVELLEQEVQELQGKARRTAEENGRLRRINLEWQFQKRLQEVQQRGEDEEEDEDLDMMVTIQQLEKREQNNRSSSGNVNNELEESEKPVETKATLDQRQSGRSQQSNNILSNKNPEEKTRRASAPEKLTFKERQRLFSPASSA
uniref:afadin isoform X3 n=1 Tax=Gasterosteus aculeatus aculeatus TaxID=481459 RepID=UPI001A996F80|nr:afadin isoform X3 [Gasterosteus aculeatus aculeatus]